MAFKMKNPAMAKLAKAAGSGMPLKKPSMAKHDRVIKGPDGKDKNDPHTHTSKDGRPVIQYPDGGRTLDSTHKDYDKYRKIAREKTLKKMEKEGRDAKKIKKSYKREDKIREKEGKEPLNMKKPKTGRPKYKKENKPTNPNKKYTGTRSTKGLKVSDKVKKAVPKMKKKSMAQLNKGFDKLPKDVQDKIMKKGSAGKMATKRPKKIKSPGEDRVKDIKKTNKASIGTGKGMKVNKKNRKQAVSKMKKAAGKMKKAVTKLGVGGAVGMLGKVLKRK